MRLPCTYTKPSCIFQLITCDQTCIEQKKVDPSPYFLHIDKILSPFVLPPKAAFLSLKEEKKGCATTKTYSFKVDNYNRTLAAYFASPNI